MIGSRVARTRQHKGKQEKTERALGGPSKHATNKKVYSQLVLFENLAFLSSTSSKTLTVISNEICLLHFFRMVDENTGCPAFVQVSSLTCWLQLAPRSVAFQLALNRCEWVGFQVTMLEKVVEKKHAQKSCAPVIQFTVLCWHCLPLMNVYVLWCLNVWSVTCIIES